MSGASPADEWVADTVALVVRLEGRTLGAAATAAFDLAEAGKGTIHVPALIFAEIMYLAQKGRIGIGLADVADYLNRHPNVKEAPLSLAVVQAASRIDDIRELHDRLIAATAMLLGLPLLTCDATLQASRWVTTLW
jgi:predicted nucleic acid-binding protein